MRTAEIKRKTKETDIELRLTLEGRQRSQPPFQEHGSRSG